MHTSHENRTRSYPIFTRSDGRVIFIRYTGISCLSQYIDDAMLAMHVSFALANTPLLKFVDTGGCTWWYQRLPYVEITLMPVRH